MLAKQLERRGYRTTTLHGSKNQEQREIGLAQLKEGMVVEWHPHVHLTRPQEPRIS